MRLLLVDNFDSFVYNLAQAFGALGAEPVVVRNDASVEDLEATAPDAVVISPGPGAPIEAGVSMDAIRHFAGRVPVFGVCLGHQCIGEVYGARVIRSEAGPVHGKTSRVSHSGTGVFRGLPDPIEATRYHSLSVEESDLPDELIITGRAEDGTIMGLRHTHLQVEGVQFHPESVLTPEGTRLLGNMLEQAGYEPSASSADRSARA
ncbi:MAG: anthranilate synthase component II [Actinomycetota bacterium]